MNTNFNIGTMLATGIGLCIAISVHECGHALVAYMFGDDTAKKEGRLSLNPLKHIDLIGLISLLVFHFGWAKPVPVNPTKFKNYKISNLLVSLAGVAFNIITAIFCVIIIKNVQIYSVGLVATMTAMYCIGLASFNLLPIPPLDGWNVIAIFIPFKYRKYMYKYAQHGFLILILLMITGTYRYIMNPIYNTIYNFILLFM
ncbi:MAG: site-2 protease family protein [Clostridioides sp.]|jgi:Zn-dependent protease|nr:site-2 protease family protein [Clostridioides sp.]